MKDFVLVPTTDFGRWLSNHMRAKNYNCSMVARMLRTSRQTVWNHVVGNSTPIYVWVMAYCSIFNDDPTKVWKIVEKSKI